MTPNDCKEEISKPEFDRLARTKEFSVGPFAEEPSKEYGTPYIAPLWLFGKLKDGRCVKAKRI